MLPLLPHSLQLPGSENLPYTGEIPKCLAYRYALYTPPFFTSIPSLSFFLPSSPPPSGSEMVDALFGHHPASTTQSFSSSPPPPRHPAPPVQRSPPTSSAPPFSVPTPDLHASMSLSSGNMVSGSIPDDLLPFLLEEGYSVQQQATPGPPPSPRAALSSSVPPTGGEVCRFYCVYIPT